VGSFSRPKRTYKLVFQQPDLQGLEVRVRSLPLGRYLEMASIANATRGEQIEHLPAAFEALGECLVDWNLTEETDKPGIERPVPCSLEGLYSQEPDIGLAIFVAWFEAMSSVSGPLVPPSSSGGPSPVASLKMEPLSPNQWS
jgi:hypothetical protein